MFEMVGEHERLKEILTLNQCQKISAELSETDEQKINEEAVMTNQIMLIEVRNIVSAINWMPVPL
jgi:tRNA G10  N-methylase Trm11